MPRPRAIPDSLLEVLNESSRPIYTIDDRRRIVFCNPALSAWLELEPERVVGRFVEYHSEPVTSGDAKTDSSAPLADLCPPPQALAGEPCAGTISCAIRGGRLAHRSVEFIPLPPMADRRGRTREGCSVLALLGDRDLSPEELAASSDPSADELHRTIRRFRRVQASQYALESLLGNSPAMQKVRAQVAAAAASGANAIVCGAPGTGRGHVARAIHYHAAADPAARLIPLDCETATDDSLRRALDALHSPNNDPRQRHTLLLEQLDCLTAAHQTQLLGAMRHAAFRARVIATCSRHAGYPLGGAEANPGEDKASVDAANQTQANGTRSVPATIDPDLFEAVSTITIYLPRLRERLEDLPILAQCFLESCNRGGKQVGSVRGDALDQLALYAWPGELVELGEAITAAHAACETHEIIPVNLPAVIHHASQAALRRRTSPERIILDELLARIEREAIERALAQANGNKTEAAELLGMTRPRLYRRLIQLGLVSDAKDVEDQAPEFIEQLPSDDTP
jgi:DNA-binding NtrC family response regulator